MTDSSNEKLVVLQVLPALHSGGVERGTVDLAKALAEAGHTSLVASKGGPMVEQFVGTGVEHIQMPLASKNPLTIKLNTNRLVKLIRKRGVNILHARSRAPAWSAYVAAQKTQCAFVTTFHGTYSLGGAAKKHYNSVMTYGDRVIAISKFIAQHIKENYDISKDKLKVIQRGVDLNYFNSDNVTEKQLAEAESVLKPHSCYPIVIMPGRFTRWKGHEFLIRSLARIPHREYTCVLLGDTKGHKVYLDMLMQLKAKFGLRGNIMVAEHSANMPAIYKRADLVVAPSIRPEAFGRVAIEAQAMGTPIVATKHGGFTETILNGKTGWLVEPEDEEAMAEAIEKALAMKIRERNKMAKQGRERVEKYFSLDKMVGETFKLYWDVLKAKQ